MNDFFLIRNKSLLFYSTCITHSVSLPPFKVNGKGLKFSDVFDVLDHNFYLDIV